LIAVMMIFLQKNSLLHILLTDKKLRMNYRVWDGAHSVPVSQMA
jgi:hypothetical protein